MTIRALGSEVTVVVTTSESTEPADLFSRLARLVYEFERRCSRFLPASELSLLNKSAGQACPISDELRAVIVAAQKMSLMSSGLYNPMLLPAVQRSGYVASAVEGHEHDAVDNFAERVVSTVDKIAIKSDSVTLPFNTALDLGGCGKGYLADQMADILDGAGLAGYWVSLGGDMVTSGVDTSHEPWITTIQSADPSREAAAYYIQSDGSRIGIATSGTSRRPAHQTADKRWHHIIDPRTLRPAETDVRLLTTVASRAIEADVLASCGIIVGSERAEQYLRDRNVVAMVLQAQDASQRFDVAHFGVFVHKQERLVHA